jgi:hypothetical protein
MGGVTAYSAYPNVQWLEKRRGVGEPGVRIHNICGAASVGNDLFFPILLLLIANKQELTFSPTRDTMSFRLPSQKLSQAFPKVTMLSRASTLAPRWARNYATEQQGRTAIVTGSSRGM